MVCIFANCKKIFKVKNYTDIIIVGAGLSGVGAACHLERKNPEKSYVIFEAREELGKALSGRAGYFDVGTQAICVQVGDSA